MVGEASAAASLGKTLEHTPVLFVCFVHSRFQLSTPVKISQPLECLAVFAIHVIHSSLELFVSDLVADWCYDQPLPVGRNLQWRVRIHLDQFQDRLVPQPSP